MARGFTQAPGASADVLNAARRELDRADMAPLAQSRHRTVRETIARRTDIPVGIQAALAQDDSAHVRVAIAANAATAKAVLDHLSADRNEAVLLALLTNPSAPFALVEGLAFHRRREVRRLAVARLNDAAPVLQAEAPRAEDAMFPELRERAMVVGPLSLSPAS
jgi:hypothetical protein